jgi:hypothetical protein
MNDLFWFIFIGAIAMIAVIMYIVRDAEKSPALAGMNDVDPSAELTLDHAAVVTTRAGAGWQTAGWLVGALGAAGLLISMFLDTSVQTYGGGLIGGGAAEVVNLHLMFRKGVVIACSLTALSAGLFCLAVGAVIRAIHSRVV